MDNIQKALFAKEVKQGLRANPKTLSSKWFYDEIGDQLFVKIMNMPEYYLTDAEFEIFSTKSAELIEAFGVKDQYFELIELGAGDGTKTIELLKALRFHDFAYRPIDISINAIENLEARVKREVPEVKVKGAQGEYFTALSSLKSNHPKVILFMGSNLGNMLDDQANSFLKALAEVMNAGDKLLLGLDLIKAEELVLPAYNDAQGYTAAFNLNLLTRMNNELGANFEVDSFDHKPKYDYDKGLALSFLESKKKQTVQIEYLNESFDFEAGEKIFMEVSRKYDDSSIMAISDNTDLKLTNRIYDSKHWFTDLIFEKQ
ncbi:MAG: L-histidine N(alpha)-methyltransferase [Salibacteraceae bacterium]|jgi:L-histidine Nalpha-methyltransferase|nr:L-histidine N(alpha)-methyltransferase [Salibacteraceae bacterium]MDP4686383.1 L-histidine N(alpha)-methyltransferase [Salibacteraceae bacterium]MDP4843254.1 L-histidine N(alpha)-methyltransferase [Salibacteraceae bacterium]MDP4965939.1 L-histidine N(alpha)-methyltransferase [Salibacteraceae bacterium]